ncbi:MAG: amylo-alpha-1,6-glucosidase, partial [Planctomycetota bacterium]
TTSCWCLLMVIHDAGAAAFVYHLGQARLTKEVLLAWEANVVAARYTLAGASGSIELRPFVALRDFHHLRKVHEPHGMQVRQANGAVVVQDELGPPHALSLRGGLDGFVQAPQWWYNFRYRTDLARGQDGMEDLFTPGLFSGVLRDGQTRQFTAALGTEPDLDFQAELDAKLRRHTSVLAALWPHADEPARRLALASEAFLAQRTMAGRSPSTTILAGFPWFVDWGRDAFIALPGLLLTTKRFDQAREIFQTFAAWLSEGMVPNRFDDYGDGAHYNSMDASLWFILAADRYLAATRDTDFWAQVLMPTVDTILRAYHTGTRYGIHADDDGLLTGGDHDTQLTWMDAKLGREVVTPRHGKPVELNSLWYYAHRMMALRCAGTDASLATAYAARAKVIAEAFRGAFWNAQDHCLYDCIQDGRPDASVRPNQIFAASLPHSPLTAPQRQAVVRVVTERLLTPRGLRTLDPADKRYRGQYGGSWESRDRAYHQGTVWAWLMGPFIEACLRTETAGPATLATAQKYLDAFNDHFTEAGLGTVSEVFDGDAPHRPGGCIAQAWSVAELLRARQLLHLYRELGHVPA